MAIDIDAAGTIAPIEISSSAAIIRKPIGMAMIPRFAATLSQLAAPAKEVKVAPPKAAKKFFLRKRKGKRDDTDTLLRKVEKVVEGGYL